ncbi:MAG TPA: SMI1/KNR4 family protein [Segetibacter sp.]|jgi:hypothetical protein
MLNELLELERELIAVGHPVIESLQPGLTEPELLKLFKPLRLLVPPELLELYKWHNGVSNFNHQPSGKVDFLPLGIFFPFSLALEQYEEYRRRYGAHLWPIMGSGDSDNYLINLSYDKKHHGKIYFASIPLRQKPYIQFTSLTHMVEVLIACYRDKAYVIGSDNFLDLRDDLEKKVFARFGVET